MQTIKTSNLNVGILELEQERIDRKLPAQWLKVQHTCGLYIYEVNLATPSISNDVYGACYNLVVRYQVLVGNGFNSTADVSFEGWCHYHLFAVAIVLNILMHLTAPLGSPLKHLWWNIVIIG